MLRLIALGHKAPRWVEEGCADYRKRLPKEWRFEERLLKAERRSEHMSTDNVKHREAERIEEACKDFPIRVVLDERGKLLTSRELAALIQSYQDNGQHSSWIIGGTDGLDERIVRSAHQVLSLSRFTLPHDLARLVLTEQLYRASTVIEGHPYHRD
jgi:23S rRNA (pseudouridine1915-N3)-methyltransferase